jgi:hypothetical protein
MSTAFDKAIEEIKVQGFHNHRLEKHSRVVSEGILCDLLALCEPFKSDFQNGRIKEWFDFPLPAGRARKLDLIVAEVDSKKSSPDITHLRLCVENKSVITAHRNRTNRYDDLSDLVGVLHRHSPKAILVATVLIGLAEKVLNVPDRLKLLVPPEDFVKKVSPRLSTGDNFLWEEFPNAVSHNRPSDPEQTVKKFRGLPTRPPKETDLAAYDYVLLIPVRIDNVNPPEIARDNSLGIKVDAEYSTMLERICEAYTARWHP